VSLTRTFAGGARSGAREARSKRGSLCGGGQEMRVGRANGSMQNASCGPPVHGPWFRVAQGRAKRRSSLAYARLCLSLWSLVGCFFFLLIFEPHRAAALSGFCLLVPSECICAH
jgi:hypothetical protein